MRGFSITLTVVNGVYLATGAVVTVFVLISDDPYAGLALIPWLAAWPVLAVAAIVWVILARVKRDHVRERVSLGWRRATIGTSVAAFLPFGLLLGWYLVQDILPEWRM